MKYTWFLCNQANFAKLCQDLAEYWDYHKFSNEARLYGETMENIFRRFIIVLWGSIFCTVIFIVLIVFFTNGRIYVIYVGIEIRNPFLMYTLMASQYYVIFLSAWVNVCYDLILISLCCQTAIQLKLLAEEMRKIGFDMPKEKFVELVQHHQLVIR